MDARLTIMEAISLRRLVAARYNGAVLRLAPHQLFERHGDLFLGALNMDKTWREDEEPRLGQFKLAGLAEPALLDETFEPLPSFEATAPRQDDTLVFAV